MLKAVEGVYQNGIVQLSEAIPDAEGSRVVVTFLTKDGPIDFQSRGISAVQAADMRQRFVTFIEDWDSPEMDVYNDL